MVDIPLQNLNGCVPTENTPVVVKTSLNKLGVKLP